MLLISSANGLGPPLGPQPSRLGKSSAWRTNADRIDMTWVRVIPLGHFRSRSSVVSAELRWLQSVPRIRSTGPRKALSSTPSRDSKISFSWCAIFWVGRAFKSRDSTSVGSTGNDGSAEFNLEYFQHGVSAQKRVGVIGQNQRVRHSFMRLSSHI